MMLQGVIGRLASNSASCKTWCTSLTSALAVVAAQADRPDLLFVAALPIFIFGALDAYYLGLERRFRGCYERFVTKLQAGEATIDDAFVIAPRLRIRGAFLEARDALGSFSVWPVYLGMVVILWILFRRL